MPWCPVCKNEYVEGYTHCKDCDVDLVDSLENAPAPIIFGEKDTLEEMAEFLWANGVEGSFLRFDEKEKTYELFVLPETRENAAQLLNAFIRENRNREEDDGQGDMPQTEEASSLEVAEAYVDKSQKAEEYKSSAMALLLVGGVGLIVLILLLLDFLPIHMYGMSKIISGIVMGAMFAGFLIMGVLSLNLQKKYMVLAEEEKQLMEEMMSSLKEGYTAEQIDARWRQPGEDEQLDEARMYYKRVEIIKTAVREKFPDVDRSLIDKTADDWYSRQFDKEAEEENE